MSTWKTEHDRTNVVCPDCAFSFDAIHQDETGGYTCPLCEPAPASGEPSGAEAVVREAYEVIDELAPQWSGSSIATVLRAFITVVDDMAQRVQRIDSGPWRRPWNSASAIIAPTAPGAPEEGAGE